MKLQLPIMKYKSEAIDRFQDFKYLIENQKGLKIKTFRSNNEGEFCNERFENFLRRQGIIHQKTNPYTPEQNGMSKKMDRSVVEKAKCLIFDAKLETNFWAEAVNIVVYLKNRSVASGLKEKTPIEMWTGKKPDVSDLGVFGSPVMVRIPKARRTKWQKKSKKMILVGYSENIKAYRLYDLDNNSITTSRDVVVMEEEDENIKILIETKPETVMEQVESTEPVGETTDENSSDIVDTEDSSKNETIIEEEEETSVKEMRRTAREHRRGFIATRWRTMEKSDDR
jgi:hypothetical protein